LETPPLETTSEQRHGKTARDDAIDNNRAELQASAGGKHQVFQAVADRRNKVQ
jgi:hypothetical protein